MARVAAWLWSFPVFSSLCFLASLAIRALYASHSWYIRDQARVFDLGFQVYHFHVLPIQGSPVVYTNSLLPGSLQALLASIPLFFAGGHPYSILFFVQLLNLLSCCVLFAVYRFLFPNFNRFILFAFFVFNPMSIIFSYGWNPSFMIPLSTIFLVGLAIVFQKKPTPFGLFLVFFPHLLLMQLNLQFLMLLSVLGLLLYKKMIPIPSWHMALLAALPGLATLSPFFASMVSHRGELDHNWHMNGSLFQNIQLHVENLFSYLHVLCRFLSFATGETTRNLGYGYLLTHKDSWFFFAVGMLGTVFILVCSLLFYASRRRWRAAFLHSTAQWTMYEKWDAVLIYIPVLATLLFVFSVTPPTTHKLWSLFPFCFYPFFRFWHQMNITEHLSKRVPRIYRYRYFIFSLYVLSTLYYSLFGAVRVPTNFQEILLESHSFCHRAQAKERADSLAQYELSTTSYTMVLLCPYWDTQPFEKSK